MFVVLLGALLLSTVYLFRDTKRLCEDGDQKELEVPDPVVNNPHPLVERGPLPANR